MKISKILPKFPPGLALAAPWPRAQGSALAASARASAAAGYCCGNAGVLLRQRRQLPWLGSGAGGQGMLIYWEA